MGVFWPEQDQEHARNALRQALHFLRSELGSAVIESRGDDEVRIGERALSCDVLAFREAVGAGRLEDALELYDGDLLPGFFLADSPEFERWLERERAALRETAVSAAWKLAENAGPEDPTAVHWARRAAALTPDDEPALQRLLRILLDRGDRAGALRAYESFRRRLKAEFGLSPSPETIRLVRQIRASVGIPADDDAPVPDAAATVDAPGSGAAASRAEPDVEGERSDPGPARGAEPGGRRRRRVRAPVGILALTLVAAVGVLTVRGGRRAGAGLNADVVVISPFEVLDSRFAVWGECLMSVLAANLDGAGPLRTVSPTVAVARWDGGYDRESAIRLGRATRAGAAVTGQLIGAGADSIRVVALLIDPAKGEQVSAIEVRGTGDRIDHVSDSLTVALLREMGRTRAIGAVRFAAIGSRSLPALKAYLRGDQFFRRTHWDSALAFYGQAVELDSTFAPAIRRMGNVLMWQGTAGGDVAREHHERAGRFNRGLAPRDSLLVLADSLGAALYGFDADPDWWAHSRRHAATLAEAARHYPDDPEVWYVVGEAGFHFGTVTGVSIAELLGSFDRAIQLDSSFAPAYLHPISLAMTAGDSARSLGYARAYLRRARDDVTARGIALFLRAVKHDLTAADSAEYAARPEPAELFEAWAPLGDLPDSAESGVRIARWLGARRWAAVMPFADPAFTRGLYARTLATRGHLREAWAVSGSADAGLFAELAWLGAVPEADARARFDGWLRAGDAQAARGALPWWAGQRDTTTLAAFVRLRAHAGGPAGFGAGSDRTARERAAFDTAAGMAWLTLARGDTAAALERFNALPDSLCPTCYLHRIPRAELLLDAGRAADAYAILERELAVIVGGPRPLEIPWRLLRAEAAERTGRRDLAVAGYRNVLDMWRAADAGLAPFVQRARAGLERARRVPS
jgi:serine/threonine-protein kinase